MVYSRASSQSLTLVENLPDLSELENIPSNNNSQFEDPRKYDKFIRDNYVPPQESGMTNSNNKLTSIHQSRDNFNYIQPHPNFQSQQPNIQPPINVMDNETPISLDDSNSVVDLVIPQTNIETNSYKEPNPTNELQYTPWPQPPLSNHYNFNKPFYPGYPQPPYYPPIDPQQYNHYVQPHIPIHYPNSINGYSVPIEGFDGNVDQSLKSGNTFKNFNHTPTKNNSYKNDWDMCIKCSEHIKNCPICSKIYKNNNNNIVFLIIIVVLSLICLILLHKVINQT